MTEPLGNQSHEELPEMASQVLVTPPLPAEGIGPLERKVIESLSSKEWDFRTVEGIAAETGLSDSFVSDTLRKYPSIVRVSPIPDRCGRTLFTLRDRPKRKREILAELRAFLAGSSR